VAFRSRRGVCLLQPTSSALSGTGAPALPACAAQRVSCMPRSIGRRIRPCGGLEVRLKGAGIGGLCGGTGAEEPASGMTAARHCVSRGAIGATAAPDFEPPHPMLHQVLQRMAGQAAGRALRVASFSGGGGWARVERGEHLPPPLLQYMYQKPPPCEQYLLAAGRGLRAEGLVAASSATRPRRKIPGRPSRGRKPNFAKMYGTDPVRRCQQGRLTAESIIERR